MKTLPSFIKKKKIWLSDNNFITVYFLNNYVKIEFNLQDFIPAFIITTAYSNLKSPVQFFNVTLDNIFINTTNSDFSTFDQIFSADLNKKRFHFLIHKYNWINKDINNSNVNDYLYDMQECINIFVISPYFEDHFLIAKEKERLDKIENGGSESD